MKISVFFDHILQAASQTGESIPQLLSEVKEAGIDAVEINLNFLLEHQEILPLLKQTDLKISCIYEFYEMNKSDETEKIRKHIETAVHVNAKKILVVPGFLPKEEADKMQAAMKDYTQTSAFFEQNDKIRSMANQLSYAVNHGKISGVKVTVEDFDDKNSPLSGMNGILWFLKHVPDLGCTFDMGNFVYSDEDVLKAWDLLKHRILHVHCKDRGEDLDFCQKNPRTLNKGLLSVATGEGYLPIDTLIQQLTAIGYDDYLAIEHFDAPNQRDCMKLSARNISHLWAS